MGKAVGGRILICVQIKKNDLYKSFFFIYP